jgi:hypothetical protein
MQCLSAVPQNSVVHGHQWNFLLWCSDDPAKQPWLLGLRQACMAAPRHALASLLLWSMLNRLNNGSRDRAQKPLVELTKMCWRTVAQKLAERQNGAFSLNSARGGARNSRRSSSFRLTSYNALPLSLSQTSGFSGCVAPPTPRLAAIYLTLSFGVTTTPFTGKCNSAEMNQRYTEPISGFLQT